MWGEYPREYNPRVHGPYDPARYYGKPDVPFSSLKLGDIPAWISRREFTPYAVARTLTRARFRFWNKSINTKRMGSAPYLQLAFFLMLAHKVWQYPYYAKHRPSKYSW